MSQKGDATMTSTMCRIDSEWSKGRLFVANVGASSKKMLKVIEIRR